ncbi:MAG: zinc-binding dehydrogenase [Deltaproteobacteria bacterium]|nr:zinc-binding dehydrogenase [Deltaproteobacteria bacterium]
MIALVGKAEDKESVARGFGADHIVRYRDENVVERIRSLTHRPRRGVDLQRRRRPDAAPAISTRSRPLGTVVLYGGAGGLVKSKELMVALMSNFTKSAALRVYHLTTSIKDDPREHHIGLTRLIVGLQNRRLQALVGGTYDLSDVAAAHTALESGRTVGKLILKADA